MGNFELDPKIAADSLPVCRLKGFEVRLVNDARWPWLLVVPRRASIEEWHDLTEAEADALSDLTRRLSINLKALTAAEKINVAALGNIVRQFHLHIVARKTEDANWPGPVWGFGEPLPYSNEASEALIRAILEGLELE